MNDRRGFVWITDPMRIQLLWMDHVDRAVRLFKANLIRADRRDQAFDAAFRRTGHRWCLPTATGSDLDDIGEMIGLPRRDRGAP